MIPEASSIDQGTLDAQRAKGWTDFHPEDYCHRCYKRNTSWYVDTSTWNEVMRGGDPAGWGKWQEIICIPCFTELAAAHYGTERVWTIARDGPSIQLTVADHAAPPPHMLADAWDASAKATAAYELEYRVNFDYGDDLPEPPANPYRSQT